MNLISGTYHLCERREYTIISPKVIGVTISLICWHIHIFLMCFTIEPYILLRSVAHQLPQTFSPLKLKIGQIIFRANVRYFTNYLKRLRSPI